MTSSKNRASTVFIFKILLLSVATPVLSTNAVAGTEMEKKTMAVETMSKKEMGAGDVMESKSRQASQMKLTMADSFSFGETRKAIKGYDVISYLGSGKPVKGTDAFSYEWSGVTWYFASAENLEKFKLEPERYAPEYGNVCACGLAEGYIAEADPQVFHIFENRLYLFHNADKKEEFINEKDSFLKKAEQNFVKVYSRKF